VGSTPEPTPLGAPAPPPATLQADVHGAEAAAHYAIDVLNQASVTGDTTTWTQITAPACVTCVSFASDIAATGPDPGGTVRVASAKPTEIDPGAFYTVALAVDQEPHTRADGTTSSGGRYALLFALRFTDTWIVEAIDVGAADAPWAS